MRRPYYNNKVFRDEQEVIDILTPFKDSVMLCLGTAADFRMLSNGSLNVMNIQLYSKVKLEIPDMFVYYEPNCFEEKEYTTFRGIYVTTDEQTILDLLEDVYEERFWMCPSQTVLESLSNYYYKYKESFNGLEKRMNKIQRKAFETWKQWAIEYYDD